MPKMISFDIGIRNMAYCIFETDPILTISEWTVLNVGETPNATPTTQYKCTCMTKAKSPTKCDKPAVYTGPTQDPNTKYYCKTHAKTSGFLLPKKIHEQSALKKRKAADLYAFIQSFMTPNPPTFAKKQDALDFAKTYFETHSLKPLDQPTKQNVKEIDLLTIGRNIKILFDQSTQMADATHVIIENQISPLANRMKTIQGMVAQYFIMKNPNIQIEFISSANKLKGFAPATPTQIPCMTPPEITQVISSPAEPALRQVSGQVSGQDRNKYKQHKSDAITICREFLAINPCLTSRGIGTDAMATKKRDDLADCFLQGIWYLKSKNIISYAENLKINSI
jgi:hypothetical protein